MSLRGYRKLIVAVVAIVCCSVLAGMGLLPADTYSAMILSITGGFFAVNYLKTDKEAS